MNISKLYKGQTFKSYKVLCEELEEPTKTGKSKQIQMNDWERYFSYSKSGYTFIIDEIYDTPEDKIDLRRDGNNKVKYIASIEKLILDLLVQDGNDGQVFLSKNKLLQALQMVNSNYSFGKNKPFKLSKLVDIDRQEIDDFYEVSDSMLKRNLESALNDLRNQSLITWKQALTVCFIDTYISYNESNEVKAIKYERIDSDGDLDVKFDVVEPYYKLVHRKATPEEEQLIIRVERDMLKQFNCKKVSDIFKRGKSDEFYKQVREILFEQSNIYLYYNSYEIISNKDQIIEEWEELEKFKTQNELNNDIINKLNNNAVSRHNISFKKYEETKKQKYQIRMSDTYIDNTHKLTETLIKKDTPNLKYN